MTTNTLEFTQLQNKIFRLLCIKSGENLNQRQIAKLLNATPSGIAKALTMLEKKQIVNVKRDNLMNLNSITLNRNQKIMQMKQIENLKQIYETELVDFLENEFPGSTIIMFGSFTRGEDTTNSDIDLAIIEAKNKTINLKEFETKLERTININFYKSFSEINKHLKENLCNGITLSGGIEL